MSIRAIPLILLVVFLYVGVVYGASSFGGDGVLEPDAVGGILRSELFSFPMIAGKLWVVTWGDVIILLLLVTLFVEILKATYTSTTAMVDHGLSMVVFIVCLVMFLLLPKAQTSIFFFITVAAIIDVVAGYTIGIRVARRDIGFGGMGD
ncbi:MAG: hypothetical protein AAFY27_11080 [Pseudomonadota bacterium]